MKNFDAILLTAGKSSRMGQDKALLEINGEKVINIILKKLLNSIGSNVYVVLGHNKEKIEKHIKYNVKIVYNENYENGMYSSIKKGMTALSGNNHVILHMIDQPFIKPDLYHSLIDCFDKETMLLQPEYKGKKGHPIIINKKLVPLIKNDNLNNTLRDFLKPYYKTMRLFKYDNDTVLQNLNNYESFKSALNKAEFSR